MLCCCAMLLLLLLCGVIFLTDIVVLILVICFNHLWGYSRIQRFEGYLFFLLTSLSLAVFYTRGENAAIATQVAGSTFENIVLNWAMYVHDIFFVRGVIWQCFRGVHGRVQLRIDRWRGNQLENSLQTRGRSKSGDQNKKKRYRKQGSKSRSRSRDGKKKNKTSQIHPWWCRWWWYKED